MHSIHHGPSHDSPLSKTMAKLSFKLSGTVPVMDDETWSDDSDDHVETTSVWDNDWHVSHTPPSETEEVAPALTAEENEKGHPELDVHVPEPRDRMKEGHYPRLLACAETGGFDSSAVSRVHRLPMAESSVNASKTAWRSPPNASEQPAMYNFLVNASHSDATLNKYSRRRYGRGSARQFWPGKRWTDRAEEYRAERATHAAVVIDLEMVGCEGEYVGTSRDEMVAISVIDFFTGERLMDNLVRPRNAVNEWRTHIHGIAPEDLDRAEAAGTLYADPDAARRALHELMDSDTVLVGHGVGNDINMLRIDFRFVVENQILADNALRAAAYHYHIARDGLEGRIVVSGAPLPLKKLADLAGVVDFRAGERHDAWEDVMATREVALCLFAGGHKVYIFMLEEVERRIGLLYPQIEIVIRDPKGLSVYRYVKSSYIWLRGPLYLEDEDPDPYDRYLMARYDELRT